MLGLHCCTQAFSSCGKWGLLSGWGAQASHLWYFLLLQSMGSRVFGLQELWHVGLAVPYVVCGIFLDQRLKPCALQSLNNRLPGKSRIFINIWSMITVLQFAGPDRFFTIEMFMEESLNLLPGICLCI